MLKRIATGALSLAVATSLIAADQKAKEEAPVASEVSADADRADVPAVLNFKMNNLAGEEVDLAKYKGKVVMMVNTASECGFTPQYEGLEKMHEKYADQGLVILGFPANEFGKQEPGTDPEIAEFCKNNYNVQFDMFGKVAVAGPKQCALYKFLTSAETNPKHAGPVKWNFEKFVISRDGHVVGRYASAIAPDSAQIVKKIETELAKK